MFKIQYPTDHLKKEDVNSKITELSDEVQYIEQAREFSQLKRYRRSDVDSESGSQIKRIDVPGDGSCLFWSVTMAYLIPVRNDDALFRQRYEVLFGNDGTVTQNLDHIRGLVRNLGAANYDDTFANLVRNLFRNRVVDHISSYRNEFRDFVEGDFERYLENMRNPDTWGGEPEIRAMSGMLSATISVSGEVETQYGNGDIQIQLFHVGAPGKRNHYNFGLERNIIDNDKELAKGLKRVMGKVRPQDFELIQLLIEEADKEVGISRQDEDFKSFEPRFQSFVDQIPSYLHSVEKAGFFTHFFLGSFSTLLDTEMAKKLDIKEIYFSFDGAKTLKVAIIKNGEMKSQKDVIDKVKLFVISESGSHSYTQEFDQGELKEVLGKLYSLIENNLDKIKVKSIKIIKDAGHQGEIVVDVKDKGVDIEHNSEVQFKKVRKGLWRDPEVDIAKLAISNQRTVKASLRRILDKIYTIHSEYADSLIYASRAREAAHHGFAVGVFMNFHYRYNFRVYPEQFAGRGYADIILLARGPDRALDSIPIIIELKAGAGSNATPDKALQQAEKYAQGFQPNIQRVLTTADDILCVGVNLDNPSPISDIKVSNRGEEIIPLFQDMLKSADDWDTQRIGTIELKGQVKDNLERIYHTFPGTPEKGDKHYFSRFLLGQSLLLNRVEDLKTGFKKYIFIYGDNIPTEVRPNLRGSGRLAAERARERLSANLDASHAVVTMVLIPENTEKLVYVINIVEANRKDVLNGLDEVLPLDRLNREIGNREIIELNLNFDTRYKSDFKRYLTIWTEKYNSLQEYNNGDNRFQGTFKEVTYPNELKETFDKALDIQSLSIRGYSRLLEKIGEGIFPFKSLVNKEAHFQGILNGVFSYYSDLKLQESPETRALVLTEFQTGRGERIDMLVHGIKFVAQGGNAEEYTPIGLELKASRQGKGAQALLREANDQINEEYKEGVTYKTLTDGDEVKFIGVVFDKGSNNPNKLILTSRTTKEGFIPVGVVHSSHHMLPTVGQCSKRKSSSPEYPPSKKPRRERSVSMACIDSFDEEKITKEEKKQRVKELFDIDNAKDLTNEIVDIGREQVFDMIGNADRTDVKVKDNNGNDKKLIIGDIIEMKNAERYFVDDYSDGIEILVKVGRDKDRVIKEKIKGQNIEYYLSIDGYEVKFDDIIKNFTTDAEREKIHNKLHQLSNDKQLLENKKYIEDIGDVQTNQDYSNIVEEIKQNLLAKGVREDTFDTFKNHFDDLGEKVFADYISNVESSLQEKGIAFDRDKFDSAKIKGAKGGKFFSMMAIYDLLDSIGDTATLGRHDNNALKQVFGINGILDAMDDVRTSVSISSNSKVGKLISKVPQPVRQTFVKIISNPIVQSITFATIAYQFGYSINEIAQGNHHPLNYYWTASSGVKLASMSIRPISASVSFTVKSVSATTKILRGLSAAGKVLGRVAVVTMVADVLITIGVEVHERIEYTKAIAEQVPLLPGGEQAEVFFAGVIKFFTGRDVEKEYEDTIRIKGYLTYVKEAAIKLLNDNYDIDAVVQYVISIEEKYSEVIKNMGAQAICIMPSPYGPECATQMKWTCDLEKKYKDISFDKINIASSVKRDLSSIDISKILTMTPYTLVMSEGWERFICGIKNSPQCYQEIEEKKVYVVNTDAKHIPHLTKYEYENLGLRIVDAPLTNPIQKSQCSKTINTKHTGDDAFAPCNSGKIYRNCQESFTLSGGPFIFTNPTRKEHSNTKKQTFPRGSVLYISGPKTLTAAANYPAVMHIPEGSNIRYVGSKNNETIFIINDYTSGTLEGGPGKENTLVMNVKANNVVANLHGRTIRYGNSNNIRLVNTYNYVSNSDSKQNITTHCKTRLINVKNAEVWQNSFNCTDKDYEVRVVNKENVHNRGLKQTIFVVNEDSDNAKIVSDLGSTGKIKGNIDIIKVQVANITQWGISEDIEKVGYSLDVLANNTQSIVSSTKINDFKNLVIQVNSNGITESVAIQDKSLSDTIEDIRYQELKSSGSDISREVIQNSAKKLKAFIQASILDQQLLDTYQIAKDIVNNNNFDIPVSQVEVIKNHMGVPSEKVIIAGMYSGQVIVDFSYSSSDVTSSYQKYLNGGRNYGYDDYLMLCNYYQDITIEGEKGQHQYIIKLPDTLNSKTSLSPIRLNLKIKNKVVSYQNIPYSIIDFAELSVTDVDGISIEEGKRDYINECYGKSISDLTEDSLKIQDITIFDSVGTKWSLSIGLVDYFQNPENQQIVLRINNELYKIDSTNLRLEHLEINPSSFRYYQPEEQGLQIYHNQPTNKNDVGLVDFRDKSILDFDTEIADDSLVLSHKNNTLAKVENWNTYQPAREMMFAFNDTMVSNLKCIVSTCNSEDIIEDFYKETVDLLKEQVFNATLQRNNSKAEDLIKKIKSIDIGNEHELTPLNMAIQGGRLDVVKVLFDRKDFSVENKDALPLHLAAQEGKLNIAEFLIDKGYDIKDKAEDKDSRTPLRIAGCNGNLDVVKFFLSKDATSIEDRNNDPYKMMETVKVLKKEIINQAETVPNVKRWAEFFVEKLKYSIKNVVKEKLKDGMLHDRYGSVNTLANDIYNFDQRLFNNTIKGVINDVYRKVDTKKILSCVESHNDVSQRILGYVAVFNAMQRNNDLNNSAVFKLAYYVKEAIEMKNYPDVHQEERSNLEKLKSRLPESVRNAVFSSKVCIKNIYQGEYLYAANKCFNYDTDRRMAFTWTPKNEKNDKFRWNIKPDGDNFYIVNVAFNETLYAASNYFNYDNDRRMAFTWIPGEQVTQGVWKIEPNGDKCNIRNVKHNEYLYAADYAKYDKDRRRVFTWIPGGKVMQGVWKIEDCGSNVRKVRDIVSNAKGELDQELLDAVKVGDMSKVRDSVNRGANVNTEDRDGNTPARNAVLKGHFGIFKYLVENGVSLEGKDHRCRPSICDASYSGNLDILKYLIGKGVDINESDNNGWTPLHFAAWRGYLEVANFLIEKGANINVENIFGRKPIHVAAENNNTNIIEFFLSKGMSIDDVDRYGRTPLYCASWNGHLGVVKYLVEKGADVYTQDKGGKTLLDIATHQERSDVVDYLKQVQLNQELLIAAQYGNFDEVRDLVSQGASLNAKYSNGMTVMHSAAYGGNLDIVKYFVADAKNSLEIKDNGGRVPLHYAAYNGKLDVVKYFVDEGEVDVNLKDSDGQTALHMASGGGHLDVVGYLASKGADIKAKDKDGKTPLDIAIDRKHDSIVKYLKQAQLNEQLLAAVKDSDFNEVQGLVNRGANVNAKDKDGKTPLHYASCSVHHLGMVKYLISKGADIDVKDNSGRTPEDEERYTNSDTMRQVFMQAHLDKELLLTVKNEKDLKTISDLIAKDIDDRTHGGFYYTWSGNLGTVEFLVSKDVSVNATDKYGCTLLHWAALKGHSDIAKFLVDKEANVNAKDILGRTPIHFAVMNNHKDIQDVYGRGSTYTTAESSDEEVIQLFLMRGASINEADKNGETPLHLASWGGHLDTLQHLINNGANISTKDSSGNTPLDIARDKGHNNLVQYLQQTQLILDKQLLSAIGNSDFNKVRGLIAQGANIDTKDKDGSTLLYSAAEIGDLDRIKFLLDNGANIETKNGEYQATPLHGAVLNERLNVVKLLLNRGANVNAEDKDNWTPLHYAADTNSLDIVKVLVDAHANLDARGDYGKAPLDIARDSSIAEYLEKKLNEKGEKPVQRRRRHHHGDHNRNHNHSSHKFLSVDSSNQPGIAASSSTRPSSWINDLFGWVKSSVSGLLASELPEVVSGTKSPISQIDAKMDVNGAIMLLDVLVRNVTGQKYISTADQSISQLEAQGYALNITEVFKKVIEQAGLKSGVSMHRLNIDFVEIQKEVTGKIMSGKFDEISGVLSSYLEKACPSREAGCPGKLSSKKFDKFMVEFNSRLNVVLNRSIQRILHNRDGRLEVDGAKQMNLEPQSYLSNASVQGHSKDKVSTCLSEIGVTKLVGNLNR
ncbi:MULTISPECIES: ankyrin repeat domain-containing protein [unclassified Wolbachia]|uniref:ankyrin repeat domain-containing protein n=1 Tax=unclassified Wolbachia TaxID=2640676 RepID=UPI002226A7E1|nr:MULTISPECIES: ankyrin repeat domain-containing protein [unclassified Wolbachia]